MRQRISRLVRETLSFSKQPVYGIGAIRYFICAVRGTGLRRLGIHGWIRT